MMCFISLLREKRWGKIKDVQREGDTLRVVAPKGIKKRTPGPRLRAYNTKRGGASAAHYPRSEARRVFKN
jgi:hypothetical protein